MRLTRATAPALEAILGEEFPLYTPGFVRVIDYMGNDEAIVQAARVSYGAGTKSVSDDTALINYLMRHRHTSPFEMCEIKLHLKLPIFVARQWVRHRTASMNEISGRYSELPEEFYVPLLEDVRQQSKSNKQGRGEPIPQEHAEVFIDDCQGHGRDTFGLYDFHLRDGVARELARINLPLSTFTEFYWKIDLHNLLHFLALRMHPHAQMEIRRYAEKIYELLDLWVPIAKEAFRRYRFEGSQLSVDEVQVLRNALAGIEIPRGSLTEREWNELNAKIKG